MCECVCVCVKLSGSEYPDRVAQCAEAADLLGVNFLRDATLEQVCVVCVCVCDAGAGVCVCVCDAGAGVCVCVCVCV